MTLTPRGVAALTLALSLSACASPQNAYVPPPTIAAAPTATAQQQTAAKTAGLGDPVRDGKLTFTVTKVEDGPAEIGDQFGKHQPLGRFLYVHMTVLNHATEAQQYVGSAQKLLAGSVEYSTDDKAGMYLRTFSVDFQQLNPGQSFQTLAVYDIPKNVRPTGIRLHDSLFSGGAVVTF